MKLISTVAALALFLGGIDSLRAQAPPAPRSLLKTWSGAICNGKVTVTFAFSEIRGDKLVGTAKDSTGGISNFAHDGSGSGSATWQAGNLTVETAATITRFRLASGKLVGTYARKLGYYNPNNRMGCPQQEQVTFQ